jgi:hypothetical protein
VLKLCNFNETKEYSEEMVDLEQFRRDCWLGIPNNIRPMAWRLLSVRFLDLQKKLFSFYTNFAFLSSNFRVIFLLIWTVKRSQLIGNETSTGNSWNSIFTLAMTNSIKTHSVR